MLSSVGSSRYLGISNHAPKIPDDQPTAELMQLAGDAPEDPQDAIVNSARAVCSALPGLVAQQIEVCQHYPDTIKAVSEGAKRGIRECQYQFRHERWNCTTRDDDYSVFGYTLQRGRCSWETFSLNFQSLLDITV